MIASKIKVKDAGVAWQWQAQALGMMFQLPANGSRAIIQPA